MKMELAHFLLYLDDDNVDNIAHVVRQLALQLLDAQLFDKLNVNLKLRTHDTMTIL